MPFGRHPHDVISTVDQLFGSTAYFRVVAVPSSLRSPYGHSEIVYKACPDFS
jgi:hypothetical protein